MTTKQFVDNVNVQSLLWDAGRAIGGVWPLLVALCWLALPVAGMGAGYLLATAVIPATIAGVVALVLAVAALAVTLAKLMIVAAVVGVVVWLAPRVGV